MKFIEALIQMQEGEQVKLPDHTTVWGWDDDEETVVLYTDEGEHRDIREVKDMDATLRLLCRSDWQVVGEAIDVTEEDPYWWEEVNFEPDEPRVFKRGMRDRNGEYEIEQLQKELRRVGADISTDGVFGPGTERAVKEFQRRVGLVVDGVVGEKTAMSMKGFSFPEALQQQDIEWAAKQLECHVAAVMAVSEVESRGRGFFGNGKPAILFERHWMYRRLKHRHIDPSHFVSKYPNIVNTRTGGYKGGIAEHDRLAQAKDIDTASALESASWGAYQIMGFHWEALGYESPQAYVAEMHKGERQHLEAFVRFIKNDPVLLKAIRQRDWAAFAKRYNGPAYRKNRYDEKMASAYKRYQQ